ncbi:ABC transporter permease subunit [Bacillus sp. 31A1R]|uniref:ABC transporter permease subunit n=1 Tax=Robertmurraya mangrovi TaxID=3098077 RepID=A0ABU5J1C4_9BACI|nr:ABC transporter permease subunit [Bacillus sp. 31A1R]MDZ5473210.1 ABC transporter permease subunit [Bacillus sp. 31A1R]
MFVQILKTFFVFILIVTGFLLILLLPKEKEITVISPFHIEAEYPFTFNHYKGNINEFFTHLKNEKGFGDSYTGVPILEETQILLGRSLKIILPAFLFSLVFGTFFGVLQFYYREKKRGKIQAFFSWFFSSFPDFFLFMTIQYVLILLIQKGFPHFSLYGNDQWYTFIIPLISITIFPFIHMVKITSAALEKEMGQEYLRTVYSKGLGTKKALIHMLWNSWTTILNQGQFIMLYILSSLPIIEKLAGYKGAGIKMLESILASNHISAFALMLPFLFIMFLTIVITQTIKHILVPTKAGV